MSDIDLFCAPSAKGAKCKSLGQRTRETQPTTISAEGAKFPDGAGISPGNSNQLLSPNLSRTFSAFYLK